MRRMLGRVVVVVALVSAACKSPTSGPDPNVPATVLVDPGAALMVSIGDTLELTATVRNASSQVVTTPVTWTSSEPLVASVDGNGVVVAVGNGVAAISAAAGGVSGGAAVTVQQVVDSIDVAGDEQAGDVGAPLDSAVVVTLLDARGNGVAGAPVAFSVTTGMVSATGASTDAAGSAETAWTLGTVSGIQELTVEGGFAGEATRVVSANAYALDAKTIALFSGDAQTELASTALAEPLRVLVTDSLGNGVPDVVVVFTVSGDAALEAAETVTDLDGVASMGLTLGTAQGVYDVTAEVPDSLTVTGTGLSGSPVALTAEAVAYTAVPPDLMTVGDTVTIPGTGFHPTLDSNTVNLGGQIASIISGSQTELTIEVPSFGCSPRRRMSIEVSRPGQSVVGSVNVSPEGMLALSVGQLVTFADTTDLCVQFDTGNADDYLIGLTSTAWFDGGATFSLRGVGANGPYPAPSTTAAAVEVSSSVTRGAELDLRDYEAQVIEQPAGTGSAPATAPPALGDVVQLRVPDLRGDACTEYVPITAEVFSEGTRIQLAMDTSWPAYDPGSLILMSAEQSFQTSPFGTVGVELIVSLLGQAPTWDADSRITVVFTPAAVPMGLSTYASAVDQLPRTTCPSSDEGNFIYIALPSATSLSGFATALAAAPPDIAHNVAHIVQWANRLPGGGNLLPSWLAEGQAELIAEYLGLQFDALFSTQDLGFADLGPNAGVWLLPRFDRLAVYAATPEQCSLFGFPGVCPAGAAAGVDWGFLRYVADRFGPTFPGGEFDLHHAIIDLPPTSDIITELEGLLGETLPDLMVDWAATLYADNRLSAGQAPTLQMPRWNLRNMLSGRDLTPALRSSNGPFAAVTGTLVGGATAYTLLDALALRTPLSIIVDNGAGGALPSVLRPRLWVLRVQ